MVFVDHLQLRTGGLGVPTCEFRESAIWQPHSHGLWWEWPDRGGKEPCGVLGAGDRGVQEGFQEHFESLEKGDQRPEQELRHQARRPSSSTRPTEWFGAWEQHPHHQCPSTVLEDKMRLEFQVWKLLLCAGGEASDLLKVFGRHPTCAYARRWVGQLVMDASLTHSPVVVWIDVATQQWWSMLYPGFLALGKSRIPSALLCSGWRVVWVSHCRERSLAECNIVVWSAGQFRETLDGGGIINLVSRVAILATRFGSQLILFFCHSHPPI